MLNGTLDLQSSKLREHRREDLNTYIARVRYDDAADAPRWRAFLQEIMPDPSMQSFLQRLVGCALSGDATEQILPILHGSGANGKSTFVEALRVALGDYATSTPFSSLLPRRPGSVPNDIAALAGRRLVVAQEPDEGVNLSESTVKLLTGGDRVSARFLHKEWFEFKPTHTIFLVCNHLPSIRGADDGIWRRILQIPFAATIAPSDRDTDLSARLACEDPGILRWAVEGHHEWKAAGLRPPLSVRSATDSYRESSDQVGRFLAACCVVGNPNSRVASSTLFKAYKEWCLDNGEVARTQTWVSQRLKQRGHSKTKSSVMVWLGLDLRTDTQEVCIAS